MASTDVEKQKLDIPPLFGSCRLTLVLISFGIVFLLFLMRFNLSMGIVCLTKNGNEIRDYFGQLQVWDKTLQGYILGAFFYGYICTQVLGGYVSDRFGGKVGVMVGIGIASLSCLLIPLAARCVFTHWGTNPQFLKKITFSKSYFSLNSHFQSLIFTKIHIFKASFFTKITVLK